MWAKRCEKRGSEEDDDGDSDGDGVFWYSVPVPAKRLHM